MENVCTYIKNMYSSMRLKGALFNTIEAYLSQLFFLAFDVYLTNAKYTPVEPGVCLEYVYFILCIVLYIQYAHIVNTRMLIAQHVQFCI
jgi:hypothetical protein